MDRYAGQDLYAHHVVMDAFLSATDFRNKDLRESNPRKSDEEDVVITFF